MSFPRISMAMLLFVILLLGVDCALLAAALNGNHVSAHANVVALPMANVLLIVGWYHQQCRRRGERKPFLLAFQIIGWATIILMLDILYTQYGIMMALVQFLEPIRQVWLDSSPYQAAEPGSPTRLRYWWAGEISLLTTIAALFLFVQLLTALLGAWIAQECRSRVNRGDSLSTDS
jgi:hypothetical protein